MIVEINCYYKIAVKKKYKALKLSQKYNTIHFMFKQLVITNRQAHQMEFYVFHFRQLLNDRPEEHAFVVGVCGDQQHPALGVVLQIQHFLRSRGPETSPHVTNDEHRCGHQHRRVQVDRVEHVLLEHLVQHRGAVGVQPNRSGRH